eukprot:2609960-Pleurochrysis_carterae.AAC.1
MPALRAVARQVVPGATRAATGEAAAERRDLASGAEVREGSARVATSGWRRPRRCRLAGGHGGPSGRGERRRPRRPFPRRTRMRAEARRTRRPQPEVRACGVGTALNMYTVGNRQRYRCLPGNVRWGVVQSDTIYPCTPIQDKFVPL